MYLTGFNPPPATEDPHGSLAPKLGSLPSTGFELGDGNTPDRRMGAAELPSSGQPGLVNGANMFAWHYCCSQWLSRAAVSIRTSEVHPSTIFHGPGKLSKALVMIPIFPGCLYSQRKEGSPKRWLPT